MTQIFTVTLFSSYFFFQLFTDFSFPWLYTSRRYKKFINFLTKTSILSVPHVHTVFSNLLPCAYRNSFYSRTRFFHVNHPSQLDFISDMRFYFHRYFQLFLTMLSLFLYHILTSIFISRFQLYLSTNLLSLCCLYFNSS